MLFRVWQVLDGLFFNFEISKLLIVRGKPFQDINDFSFRTWYLNRQLLLHNLSPKLMNSSTGARGLYNDYMDEISIDLLLDQPPTQQ